MFNGLPAYVLAIFLIRVEIVYLYYIVSMGLKRFTCIIRLFEWENELLKQFLAVFKGVVHHKRKTNQIQMIHMDWLICVAMSCPLSSGTSYRTACWVWPHHWSKRQQAAHTFQVLQ